jgi:acyl carrier protein
MSLKKIFETEFAIHGSELNRSLPMNSVLESLDIVTLIICCENEFNISFTTDQEQDIFDCSTLGDFVAILKKCGVTDEQIGKI